MASDVETARSAGGQDGTLSRVLDWVLLEAGRRLIALWQDFAALSRLLVYSGLLALLASVSTTLIYLTDATMLSLPVLQVVVPLAFGLVIAPFGLFSASILRAASVAYSTVSVGPFIPPEER